MRELILILYHLTTALLAPVIVCLLALLVVALFQFGGYLRQWLKRRQSMAKWTDFLNGLAAEKEDIDSLRARFFQESDYPGLVGVFAARGAARQSDVRALDRLVSELEVEVAETYMKTNLLIRVGPILGLMGTLIPMGPALMGLSSGNIETMATNLVAAFSTTVVGLLIGVIFSIISVSNKHWHVKDLADIEHFLDMLYETEEVG